MKTRIEQLIKSQIELENSYLTEHKQIAEILSRNDGKVINGKTLNAKQLNGLTFKKQYGMFYICGKYEHLIGYDSDPVIKADKFRDFDSCHSNGAEGRIKQLESIDINKVADIFGQIETHFNKLRELFGDLERNNLGSFYYPAYYETLKLIFDPKSDRYGKISLSDFYYIKK